MSHSAFTGTFSYFSEPITNTLSSKEITLEELYQLISSDAGLKNLTTELRTGLKSKDNDLPFVTPSGTFKRRKKAEMTSYSVLN